MANISVSHAKNLTHADWTGTVTVFNSAGTTVSAMATDLALPSNLDSVHVVGLTLSASDIPAAPFFEPVSPAASVAMNYDSGSWRVEPFFLPFALDSGCFRMFASRIAVFSVSRGFSAASTGSYSQTGWEKYMLALYSSSGNNQWTTFFTTDVSTLISRSLTVSSTSSNDIRATVGMTLSHPTSYDSTGGVTYGTTSMSASSVAATSSTASSWLHDTVLNPYVSGSRQIIFPAPIRLAAGAYLFAAAWTWSGAQTSATYSAAAGFFSRPSVLAASGFVVNGFKLGTSVGPGNPLGIPRGLVNSSSSVATSKLHVSDFGAGDNYVYWQHFNAVSFTA